MQFILEQVFFGGVLPALVMGIALFVGGWMDGRKDTEKEDTPRARGWAAALGFGLAFGAAFLGTTGVPGFLPSNALHWLFYMALLAAGVGVAEAFTYEKEGLRYALRIGLALVTFRLALGFMLEHHWTGASAWIWLGALTLGSNAIINALDRAAEERPGAMIPFIMVLLSAAGAGVLVLTGNARVAQLMGGLIAAATATLVISWRKPDLRVSRGGTTVFGLLFSALLAYGYFTSADIPAFGDALNHSQTLATLLVAVAPLMLWVSGQYPIKDMSPKRALLASAVLVALPLGAAVFVAANPSEPTVVEYELEGFDYDYGYE